MLLNIKKPTSFFSSDSPIKILDEKGNIFYIHPNKENSISFNLPIGNFSTENTLREIGFKPYVPFENHFTFNPAKGFKVKKIFNKNKATIIPSKKRIRISDKIKYKDGSELNISEYKPCNEYLLHHELAHRVYGGNVYSPDKKIIFDAEQACDNSAENFMLSHGYNPSQISLCKQLLLSNPKRKMCSQYDAKKLNFRR